jgi:hypothetical protein
MNREEALLQVDLALVRSTLALLDPGLVRLLVTAGLQEDFVRRSSLRRSVTLKCALHKLIHPSLRLQALAASRHRRQGQWVPRVAFLSRLLLAWVPRHLDFKAVRRNCFPAPIL